MIISVCVLHSYDNYNFDLVINVFSPVLGGILGWLVRKDKEERDTKRARQPSRRDGTDERE